MEREGWGRFADAFGDFANAFGDSCERGMGHGADTIRLVGVAWRVCRRPTLCCTSSGRRQRDNLALHLEVKDLANDLRHEGAQRQEVPKTQTSMGSD